MKVLFLLLPSRRGYQNLVETLGGRLGVGTSPLSQTAANRLKGSVGLLEGRKRGGCLFVVFMLRVSLV